MKNWFLPPVIACLFIALFIYAIVFSRHTMPPGYGLLTDGSNYRIVYPCGHRPSSTVHWFKWAAMSQAWRFYKWEQEDKAMEAKEWHPVKEGQP